MMRNMKIGRRLIVSFIIVLILTTSASVTATLIIRSADTQYSEALEGYGFAQGDVGLLLQSLSEFKGILKSLAEDFEGSQVKLNEEKLVVEKYMGVVKKELETDQENACYDLIDANMKLFNQATAEMSDLVLASSFEAANEVYISKIEPALEAAIEAGGQLMTIYKDTGSELSDSLTSQSQVLQFIMVGLILASIIASMFLAIKVAKGISLPIKEIVKVANEISNGNLSVEVDFKSKDEIGALSDAFRETVNKLKTYIREIINSLHEIGTGNLTATSKVDYAGEFKEIQITIDDILMKLNHTLGNIDRSSKMVSDGSGQISKAGQSLSEGAMDQASSIEELNATLSEVSRQIDSNALNAKEASELANSVAVEMEVGNQKMIQMVSAMAEINDSSKQIEMIMNTIKDIATQTNLLSLNAAIEAARAGEAGRGFAVVADEIRELADQSASAAENTTQLIEASNRNVKRGTQIADETAEALRQVIVGATNVTEKIQNISDSSQKQATALEEVTEAIEQISGVVQNNSATAQESAAASEDLFEQAKILNSLINQFKIKEL